MHDPLDELERLARTERRVAQATLVDTRGTTPRKEGAKMWVGEAGRLVGSVTIGGCVDARVIEAAETALAEGRPRLIAVDMGAEEAWEIGLSCGGTVEVLVEPVALDATGPALDVTRRLREHVGAGGRAALVTPLDGGSVAGRLLVYEDGRREGSLGDPALDAAAVPVAADLLGRGASRTVDLGAGRRVFVESYGPRATLVIVGATHVGIPLTALAKVMGFRTIVVDARPRFATRERFPDADEIRIGIPSEIVAGIPLSASTALVLLAHDYKFERPVLAHALGTEVGYIGMLGSRRRGAAVKKLLEEAGLPPAALERIRVPIGLALGGDSAAEIALAVLAEIQALRTGASARPLASAGAGR